jgi:type IV pilus assembly protein PilQ
MKLKYIIIIFITGLLSIHSFGQDRYDKIRSDLETLSKTEEGLNKTVQINLSSSSIQTFVRGIAETHQLNVNIDPSLNFNVVNNFSDAKVIDVFVFICKEYNLDIEVIGSIISIQKFANIPIKAKAKIIDLSFDNTSNLISFNLNNDSLSAVTQKITELTGQNIVLASGLEGQRVNGFNKNSNVNNALENLALSNNLKITKTKEGFIFIEPSNPNNNNQSQNFGGNFDYSIDNNGLIDIKANNAETSKILQQISSELNKNYFLYTNPKTKSTINIKGATYEEVLTYLLNGSSLTFNVIDEIYLIGSSNDGQLQSSKLIKLKNRRVDSLIAFIPKGIKGTLILSEFPELNAIIATGSGVEIGRLEQFINSLDVVVPVVNIEIIIAEVNDTKKLSTGLSAGLSSNGAPQTTSGTVLPGVNLNLSTDAINDVVSGINGLGIINLGKITPDFYLQIEAMETNGDLKVESTPSLATLNGHSASLKVGEKTYYLQRTNNFFGSQIPQSAITQTWEPVEANLEIKITPMVSEGEQVTLDINVEESNFVNLVSGDTVPPGTITREFKSMVRVRNGDLILLGGLDRKLNRDETSGIPLLSRIPIIKWFFSNRIKEKTRDKLTIFIRPTISYK